jgi:hypothetical protein
MAADIHSEGRTERDRGSGWLQTYIAKGEQRETEEADGLAHRAESLRNRTGVSLTEHLKDTRLPVILGYDFAEVQTRDSEA